MSVHIRATVVVCLALQLLCLAGCGSVYVPKLPAIPASTDVTTTQIAYPIILLHGLGQKSHVWDGAAINFYEREMGLKFGGVLSMENGRARLTWVPSAQRDFFAVSFTRPTDSVAAWSRELAEYIQLVRSTTGASKVILIAYSMGGLASRHYLVNHLQQHFVKRLITIGTPHLGSPYARVYKMKTALTRRLNDNPNFISAAVLKAALSALTACESDVAFDAPAMHDLMRPEDGGTFLDALGKAEHPSDVDYISVVGDLDVASEISKLSSSAVQEVLRRAVEFFDTGISAFFTQGDGVVSAHSQVLTNIPWFSTNVQHQRLARTVALRSVHTAHLQNSNEIQRVTLEDKPEFKGAEFYSDAGQPSLIIDYSDNLPATRSSVEVQYRSLTGERSVRVAQRSLVRTEAGTVICRAVLPMSDADFASNFIASIRISNAFSNSATAIKQWIRP